MKFTYRATRLNRETLEAKNYKFTVETEGWLESLSDERRLLREHIEKYLSPFARDETVDEYSANLFELNETWRKVSTLILFEYAMYMWSEFKQGRISRYVWAAVLERAWQSGSRGMMACVVLSAEQVREMFKAADFRTLLRLAQWEGDDLYAMYDALPDTVTLYRGVSTGISHFEEGFSWTRDTVEPLHFAVRNCHTKKEIPGIITATVKKESILAVFSFEQEVVVDPSVPKLHVEKSFLRGNDLRKFHKKFDVEMSWRTSALR